MNERLISFLIAAVLASFAALGFSIWLGLPPLPCWLFCVNLILFILMAKDKRAALKKVRRTPESTLLALAFLGATPALFLGRKVFRHKTIKEDFVAALYGITALQVVLLVVFRSEVLNLLARG